jgi:histidyl-tRNA synthetase
MAKKTTAPKSNTYVISQYFGFEAIDLPHVSKEDVELAATKIKKTDEDFLDDHIPPVEEHLALLRLYKEQGFPEKPHPIMSYHEGQVRGGHKKKRKKDSENHHHLHVIGTPKSIAETTLIQSALAILEEEGYSDVTVSLNSVGDIDSAKEHKKELTAHLRKHINDMNSTCRELFKKGVHSVIACKSLPKQVRETTPDPMSYLPDVACKHLQEVVEFLEKSEIPYDINKNILGNPHYATDTIFTLLDSETGQILATGSRYNNLSKKAHSNKKDLPGASIHIKVEPKKKGKVTDITYEEPIFYFMQIGLEAKHKSLRLINELRKNGISVLHALAKDKLSTQMEIAQRKGFEYIIIMGHREALDDLVIVRDVRTFEQETVPAKTLPAYLAKLSKKILKERAQ